MTVALALAATSNRKQPLPLSQRPPPPFALLVVGWITTLPLMINSQSIACSHEFCSFVRSFALHLAGSLSLYWLVRFASIHILVRSLANFTLRTHTLIHTDRQAHTHKHKSDKQKKRHIHIALQRIVVKFGLRERPYFKLILSIEHQLNI